MSIVLTHGSYEIDDNPLRVDLEAAWKFLSSEAYWARWRSRENVRHQVEGAWRVVACYEPGGHMVGFARALSDGIALAYLADVYVLADHRGRGLGEALVREMIEHGPGQDFRWMLHTDDAHHLYRKFAFAEPDTTFMQRERRRQVSRGPTQSDWLAARIQVNHSARRSASGHPSADSWV